MRSPSGATPGLNSASTPSGHDNRLRVLADYWALTKPEVNFLILITTFAGFRLSYHAGQQFNVLLLCQTLVGTMLVASGTAVLNQFMERKSDGQMRRTARRPLPAGRIKSSQALLFGISLAAVGGIALALWANLLASFLSLLTLAIYLAIYTPLKRKTPFCTLVGAIPGAMPPLIGWAAAQCSLSREAMILYALVFLWQFPHFMAIAWMYREDYARAGYLVLPQDAQRERFVVWQLVLPSVALVPVSLAPSLLSHSGLVYFLGTLVLGSGYLWCAIDLAFHRSNMLARRLLLASLVYLPSLFLLLLTNI